MHRYCDCEVGTCEGSSIERCAKRGVTLSAMMEQVQGLGQDADNLDALTRLRSGDDVVIPTSRRHAECMRLVAKAYVDGLDPFGG